MKKTFKTILKIRTDRKIFCVLGKEDYTNLQQSFKFSLIYAFNMISIKTSLGFPWASRVAQLVKNLPAMQETLVRFQGQEDPWRKDRLPIPVFLGFPGGLAGKESTCNEGDLGLIPGSGRSPGGGHGNPLQYSWLENPMDRGAWQATVHEVTKSQTTKHSTAHI